MEEEYNSDAMAMIIDIDESPHAVGEKFYFPGKRKKEADWFCSITDE